MSMLLNNRYRILQVLGEGGCGQTFLAEDDHLPSKRQCVVKQLKPKTSDPESYRLICERFQREAIILEKLGEENDQIPELYAYFTEAQQFYLVQQLIKGSTLAQKILEGRALSEAAVREMLISILPVLVYIHSQGIIHRDINPNNVILRQRDGKPVVIDFGVVKEMVSAAKFGAQTGPTIVVGAPGYTPPEQALGRPVYASDLYSLGLTAIHLLTGKHPRGMTDPSSGEIVWRPYAPHVSAEFAGVLDKATAFDHHQRYATAQQMLDALLHIRRPVDVERLLATIPTDFLNHSRLVFSHDLTAAAYRAEKGGRQFIVAGDNIGPGLDYVRPPVFNRDGVVAYAASLFYDRRGFKEFIVAGGQKGPEFDFAGSPVWSPDGKALAHQAGTGSGRFIVTGDVRGAEFDFVGPPVWSPDGKSVAYPTMSGGRWLVVWGKNAGPEFDYVGPPVFNPKGNIIAYPARLGRQWFVMLWNRRGPEFDYVREPVFSPDGSIVAYAAETDGKQFIVTSDGSKTEPAQTGSPVLGPDESTLIREAQSIAIGDQTGAEFDSVGTPVWSPDGKTMAYAAADSYQQFVVVGDSQGPGFTQVRHLLWNAEGSAVAYAARAKGRWFVISDRARGPELDEVGRLVFNSDGGTLLYGARAGGEIWLKVLPA